MMSKVFFNLIAMLVTAASAQAEEPTVAVGAFVDGYYAYDLSEPALLDRQYTTQPVRHNEFNINMAYVDAVINSTDYRGRLALQAGTSVQANYATEPTLGANSGDDLARHIQEAVVGVKVGEKTWVDGGIYFSHIGFENFVSKNNWNYTRSLVADFSPYYQAGVRLSHQFSEKLSGQVHILNGWQTISENNTSKSIGTQLSYNFSDTTNLTYNTLIGEELKFRHFHDVIFKTALSSDWLVAIQADYGEQKKVVGDGVSNWYGVSLMGQYTASPKLSWAGRIEGYWDKDQIIVTTGTPGGFETISASIGANVQVNTRVLWRTELRGYWAQDDIFNGKDGNENTNGLLVTSLAFTL